MVWLFYPVWDPKAAEVSYPRLPWFEFKCNICMDMRLRIMYMWSPRFYGVHNFIMSHLGDTAPERMEWVDG